MLFRRKGAVTPLKVVKKIEAVKPQVTKKETKVSSVKVSAVKKEEQDIKKENN